MNASPQGTAFMAHEPDLSYLPKGVAVLVVLMSMVGMVSSLSATWSEVFLSERTCRRADPADWSGVVSVTDPRCDDETSLRDDYVGAWNELTEEKQQRRQAISVAAFLFIVFALVRWGRLRVVRDPDVTMNVIAGFFTSALMAIPVMMVLGATQQIWTPGSLLQVEEANRRRALQIIAREVKQQEREDRGKR